MIGSASPTYRPHYTPTIATACADLKLDPLIVVYPGTRRYELVRKVLVRSLPDAVDELK